MNALFSFHLLTAIPERRPGAPAQLFVDDARLRRFEESHRKQLGESRGYDPEGGENGGTLHQRVFQVSQHQRQSRPPGVRTGVGEALGAGRDPAHARLFDEEAAGKQAVRHQILRVYQE
jgi:hypothetical protein